MNEIAITILQSLFIISLIASALTEGTKKLAKDHELISYNVIDLIYTVFVGFAVWLYMITKGFIPSGIDGFFSLVVLIAFGFISSTCGYDKVKQIFTQMMTIDK